MRQINLLPDELKPSKNFATGIKKLEKYFVVVLLLYILALGVSIGSIYFLNQKADELLLKKQSLSSELKSLTDIETSSVYIRDRVDKFKTLPERDTENFTLSNFDKVYNLLPDSTQIRDVIINKNNITFAVSVGNINLFSELLEKIMDFGIYKEIKMSGLTFTSDRGYTFNLDMTF